MPLIIHRERCVEEVDDDKENEQKQHVEGNQVVTPTDISFTQPKTQTENLSCILDVTQRRIVLPFLDQLKSINYFTSYRLMKAELK